MSTTSGPSAGLSLSEWLKLQKDIIGRLSDKQILGYGLLIVLFLGPILAGLLNWILFFR